VAQPGLGPNGAQPIPNPHKKIYTDVYLLSVGKLYFCWFKHCFGIVLWYSFFKYL